MKDFSSRLKCLKCVRASKSYMNMSWFFFDHNRKDLSIKIAKDEALLAIVITWLLRNKKILKKIDAKCYASTSHEDIRESYVIEEICRRL
jgi:hypothetical protein